MKFNKHIVYGILRYFGDAQPHRYFEQHQLFLFRYQKECKQQKINIFELIRYLVENGWVKGVGDNFYGTYFPFRNFILTNKGDKAFRQMSIDRGGDYHTFRTFDREQAKKS